MTLVNSIIDYKAINTHGEHEEGTILVQVEPGKEVAYLESRGYRKVEIVEVRKNR